MPSGGAAEERTELYMNTVSTRRRPAMPLGAAVLCKAWLCQGFIARRVCSGRKKSMGTISTLQLHTLPYFHLAPINVIIYHGPLQLLAYATSNLSFINSHFTIIYQVSFVIWATVVPMKNVKCKINGQC